MNIVEMGKFLTTVALVDNRRVTEQMVAAWLDIVGPDITLDEAHAAYRTFRREYAGEYLEPGHIYKIVTDKKRKARQWDNGLARPPAPAGKIYAMDVIDDMPYEPNTIKQEKLEPKQLGARDFLRSDYERK